MKRYKIILVGLLGTFLISGCTSTRYMTDQPSIKRQHEMRVQRSGGNFGDVLINFANIFVSAALNLEYEIYSSDRTFKRISIVNESADSLFVNMVTDIEWRENEYCDIMGIALPPGARQKLLVPYPAAYNVYFRTPFSDEEKLEIRTDSNRRIFRLKDGMTSIQNRK